jgi:hypothetical protein
MTSCSTTRSPRSRTTGRGRGCARPSPAPRRCRSPTSRPCSRSTTPTATRYFGISTTATTSTRDTGTPTNWWIDDTSGTPTLVAYPVGSATFTVRYVATHRPRRRHDTPDHPEPLQPRVDRPRGRARLRGLRQLRGEPADPQPGIQRLTSSSSATRRATCSPRRSASSTSREPRRLDGRDRFTNGYQPYTFNDFSAASTSATRATRSATRKPSTSSTSPSPSAAPSASATGTRTSRPPTSRTASTVSPRSTRRPGSSSSSPDAAPGSRRSRPPARSSLQDRAHGGPVLVRPVRRPRHEYMYAANGADTLQRWDGAAWAAPTATVNGTAARRCRRPGASPSPHGRGLDVRHERRQPLVATGSARGTTSGPGGTASNPSRVHFSNAGQPEVWETDGASGRGRNFVDLTPGDGEQIMAAVTWRELVFIFKETKFFVMWGESTAADGTPVFNFREVVNNVGLARRLAVAVGRDGVYFLNRRGVYHTNGGDPTLLSDRIAAVDRRPRGLLPGLPINIGRSPPRGMTWLNEQLFVAVPTGSSSSTTGLLVYDVQHQWWTVYDIPPPRSPGSAGRPRRAALRLLDRAEPGGPPRHRLLDDRGVNMTSRWRSGWSDYDIPQNKTFRETKMWATGAMNVGFSTDFNPTQTSVATPAFTTTATWPLRGRDVGRTGSPRSAACGRRPARSSTAWSTRPCPAPRSARSSRTTRRRRHGRSTAWPGISARPEGRRCSSACLQLHQRRHLEPDAGRRREHDGPSGPAHRCAHRHQRQPRRDQRPEPQRRRSRRTRRLGQRTLTQPARRHVSVGGPGDRGDRIASAAVDDGAAAGIRSISTRRSTTRTLGPPSSPPGQCVPTRRRRRSRSPPGLYPVATFGGASGAGPSIATSAPSSPDRR